MYYTAQSEQRGGGVMPLPISAVLLTLQEAFFYRGKRLPNRFLPFFYVSISETFKRLKNALSYSKTLKNALKIQKNGIFLE